MKLSYGNCLNFECILLFLHEDILKCKISNCLTDFWRSLNGPSLLFCVYGFSFICDLCLSLLMVNNCLFCTFCKWQTCWILFKKESSLQYTGRSVGGSTCAFKIPPSKIKRYSVQTQKWIYEKGFIFCGLAL